MKFLVCGVGSIGERHINNLLALDEKDIILYRQKHNKLRNVTINFKIFSSLIEALGEKPDTAIISNPTSLHIPLATILAKNKINLFIEKPISNSSKGINNLKKNIKIHKNKVQIGFMMRYHPAIQEIKKILDDNYLGRPLSARISWGEYLPLWHPWEDYKNSYSARKDLGGGPIFTLSHDVDLLYYFFGKPEKVITIESKKSLINTTTEQNIETLFKYKDGFMAELHLDFIQLPPKRTWEIIGDNGRLEFDYYSNKLTIFKLNYNKTSFTTKVYDYSKSFDRNNLFIDEMSDFINSIKHNSPTKIQLEDGIINLKILSAMHTSRIREKIVKISYN